MSSCLRSECRDKIFKKYAQKFAMKAIVGASHCGVLQVAVLLAAGQGGEEGGPGHAGPGGHRHQGRGGGVLLADRTYKY